MTLKRVEAENANQARYEADLRTAIQRNAMLINNETDKARIEKENANNKAAVDAANIKSTNYQKASRL